MDVVICEGDEQTGRVDLDERTYEYHGGSEQIRRTLSRMEDDEITMTRPTTPDDEPDTTDEAEERDGPIFESKPGPEDANHRDGVEVTTISGRMLGRYLQRTLTNGPRGESVRVEAVDGSLDAERITLDDAGDEAGEGTGENDEGDEEEPLSEVSFEATYGPPSEQPDAEE